LFPRKVLDHQRRHYGVRSLMLIYSLYTINLETFDCLMIPNYSNEIFDV